MLIPEHPTIQGAFQSTRPRGARQQPRIETTIRVLFQSTRPRGARRRGFSAFRPFQRFNPRAREGRDIFVRVQDKVVAVSIHAPARGATGCCAACGAPFVRFNPRAREGRDAALLVQRGASLKFQSTRPRGARQLKDVYREIVHRVSIHAPARGATYSYKLSSLCMQFQSTRPRGARQHKHIYKFVK